jgi:hypothetical protein
MPYRMGADRRGFALLAILWIVVGLSGLALALNLATREAVLASQNRLNSGRAKWMAEGCFATARSIIGSAMASGGSWFAEGDMPEVVDDAMADASALVDWPCHVTMRPVGAALDVNQASSAAFGRTLRAAKVPTADADNLALAIVAWRTQRGYSAVTPNSTSPHQADSRVDSARPPFSDTRQLHLVTGFDAAEAIVGNVDTLFTTEPGRLLFDWAPAAVLASLPGFTQEVIDEVNILRSQGEPIRRLDGLLLRTSSSGRDSLLAHAAEINALTTMRPDGWILTVTAASGQSPTVEARIEARLTIAGGVVAMVWRRESW